MRAHWAAILSISLGVTLVGFLGWIVAQLPNVP